jgi:hypothetical protein
MKKLFILATLFVATISFMSCEKDKVTPAVTYGTEVKLGNGSAKSFVKLDATGNPEELGVAISEAATQWCRDRSCTQFAKRRHKNALQIRAFKLHARWT